MSDIVPFADADAEVVIVISATTKISANSPPKATIDHLLNGARGQKVEFVQGLPDDIKDMFDLSKARGKPWGPKLFVFSPGPYVNGKPVMTRAFFMTVAWPACAAIFDVPPAEGVICEHVPLRPEDEEHDHWHVAVNHYDPLTGKARNWSWDRAKLERFSRTMEILTSSKVLVGRFSPLVIKTLREMGEHAMADAIEKANPPDAVPAGRTAKRTIEQAAKAKNIDLREMERSVRAAYVAAADRASFRAALAELGLTLEVSYRIPHRPAWMIHKDGEVLRALGGCLPRVAMPTILKKLGAPEHDGQIDIIDAIAAAPAAEPGGDAAAVRGSGAGNDHVHRPGTRLEGVAGSSPDGADARKREEIARLFGRVLTSVDPVKVGQMQQEVLEIMTSPLLHALTYFRKVIADAKAWLKKIYPVESPFLARSRDVVKEAGDEKAAAEAEEKTQAKKVKRMEMGPDIAEIGWAAHDTRLNNEKKALLDIKQKVDDKQAELENCEKIKAQFQHAHDDKVAAIEEEHSLKISIANRRIRSAVRVQELLKHHPEVAVMGAPAIFYRALKEDAAPKKPRATFKVEQPESYAPDGDPELKPSGPR